MHVDIVLQVTRELEIIEKTNDAHICRVAAFLQLSIKNQINHGTSTIHSLIVPSPHSPNTASNQYWYIL